MSYLLLHAIPVIVFTICLGISILQKIRRKNNHRGLHTSRMLMQCYAMSATLAQH